MLSLGAVENPDSLLDHTTPARRWMTVFLPPGGGGSLGSHVFSTDTVGGEEGSLITAQQGQNSQLPL